jgi:hypothetical protein
MRPLPGLLFLIASTGGALAQTAPGVIQGIVQSADGKPLSRANVYYGRTGPTKGKAVGMVLPPVLFAKAGMDGRFTLSNLPPGGWTVCAESAGYLNPCHWSTAPAFIVGAGQTISNAAIRLDPAYALRIHINDPLGLLTNEGKAAGAHLQIGVHAPSGAFQRARLAGKDSTGRDYTVAIPQRATAKLFISGGAFQLNDDTGLQLARSGRMTQVTAPDLSRPGTAAPPTVGLTVTGLGRP